MPVAQSPAPSQENWLRTYYFARAAFSVAWIALVLLVGRGEPTLAAILLVAYPAWDALANAVDAQRNGGLGSNTSQSINMVVSGLTAIAVLVALGISMNAVLVVFGVWAALSGLLQLLTALRRWRMAGAQWAMVLSGAQSALAGGFFVVAAQTAAPPVLTSIAGYAGFGAFYFLVSAIWLTMKIARARPALTS